MSILSAASTNISISGFVRNINPDFTISGQTTNISADTWGNNGMYPLPTSVGNPAGQIQWSELRNKTWFVQTAVKGGATGTVGVVTPAASALYTNSGNNFYSAQIDLTNYPTFTWRAQATYPNYVGGWYSGPNASGTEYVSGTDPNGGTGSVHTLDFTVTSTGAVTSSTVYVHFINAHA